MQYGDRRGLWYVRTSGDKGPYDWAWIDDDGNETLPVVRDNACVARDVRAVSWLADWILVALLPLIAIVICYVLA